MDAPLQGLQRTTFRRCPETLRQRHLQQVAARVGGQPRLQFTIDPIGQLHPGASLHQTARLSRDDIAGNLRLDTPARQQQIVRRIVCQAGKMHAETARTLQIGGSQHVEHRYQRAVAGHRRKQPLAQRRPAARAKPPGQHRRSGGQSGGVAFGCGGRADQIAAQSLDGQFQGVSLADRLARARP